MDQRLEHGDQRSGGTERQDWRKHDTEPSASPPQQACGGHGQYNEHAGAAELGHDPGRLDRPSGSEADEEIQMGRVVLGQPTVVEDVVRHRQETNGG